MLAKIFEDTVDDKRLIRCQGLHGRRARRVRGNFRMNRWRFGPICKEGECLFSELIAAMGRKVVGKVGRDSREQLFREKL